MAGAVIVGAGPLIGTALARRFAKDGMPVTVIARGPRTVEAVVRAVGGTAAFGVTADVTDEDAIRSALDRAVTANGVPEVVVYNAAIICADRLGELSTAELADTLAVNVLGGVTVGAHVAPSMVAGGGGSLLFTGGMPAVKPDYASLSLGKSALRTVADLFRAEYEGRGLHVATVTVYDAVAPGTPYDPDLIAEEFAALHREPADRWRHEVIFER
jgi:NAD(P)-dependent dehydrogenase (short-subunit alcohol dehydrogenase family)